MARVNNVCCNQFSFNLCSYNCRGFNFVKKEYINRLLTKCDILLQQEHWLAETQLSDLASINDMFLYHGMSGFGNEEVLIGRPYGGCAILWRSDLNFRVDVIATSSRRCAVRICTDTWRSLVINVYMPFEDGSERSDLFVETLHSSQLLLLMQIVM